MISLDLGSVLSLQKRKETYVRNKPQVNEKNIRIEPKSK